MKTSWPEVRAQWLALDSRIHRYAENDNEVSRWFGWGPVSWCAETVSYMFWLACHLNGEPSPFENTQTVKGTAYSGHFTEWARAGLHGLRFLEEPTPGAIVVYQWDTGMTDHVGMVERVTGGPRHAFDAWEGNTRLDTVDVVGRDNRSNYVVGFAMPDYGAGRITPVPPTGPAWPGRVLGLTTPLTAGKDVLTYQNQMRARGWKLAADGVYGRETEGVTREFQSQKHLAVDGQVGPVTWQAAFNSPVTPD